MMTHKKFYGDDWDGVKANHDDVEKCILTGFDDPDGISKHDWIAALVEDDTPYHIIEYILKYKKVPEIAPLYDMIYDAISGIINK